VAAVAGEEADSEELGALREPPVVAVAVDDEEQEILSKVLGCRGA
jgi:hypothetical protein